MMRIVDTEHIANPILYVMELPKKKILVTAKLEDSTFNQKIKKRKPSVAP